jgi:subtilisin family serine protease
MNKLKLGSVLAFLLAAIFGLTDAAIGQSLKPGGYVPGEVLVKYADGAGSVSARRANNKADISVIETLRDEAWARVDLPDGVAVEDAIRDIAQLEGVAAAQPNFYYNLQLTPNDPSFNSTSMWGLFKISAPAAWDLTTGSSSVVVAVIDTGTRTSHQDLAPNLWTNGGEVPNNGVDDDGNGFVDDVYGWDFFYNRANIADENGHGTHVAGTIGAAGNNGLNVVGVNWSVKIMTIKIYNNTGFGSTSAMLVNAYNYIRSMKQHGVNIRVTNNSYGGCDEACGYDQATKDGIDAMGDVGILNVFAAGNDNVNIDTSPSYPAGYNSPSILSVASSTSADARSSFSNFGTSNVDLAAPGSGILSTTFGSNTSTGSLSGTSMASPHVAGAAALLSALDPSLSASSLKATLMNQVDALPAWTALVRSGGRLNVDKALRNRTQCEFTPPSDPMRIPTKGGVYTLNFTPGANCDYRVKSNVSWIKMMGPTDHSGNGSVTFRVPVNPVISRTGTIVIGGRTMTVVQSRN